MHDQHGVHLRKCHLRLDTNVSISDEPNLHPKGSSRVEDYHITYILPKDTIHPRCGMLIAPLEMWVGNGPSEIALAHHFGHTTTVWATCTDYICRKLFMWETICWIFTIGSDTILVMGIIHTQKLAQEWRIAHHIYIVQGHYTSTMWDVNSALNKP